MISSFTHSNKNSSWNNVYITLDFMLDNERIYKEFYELFANFNKYKDHEWRITCHDGHGGIFDYSFSLGADDEVVFRNFRPDMCNLDFDYTTADISITFHNDKYLRRIPSGDDYIYLTNVDTTVRSITFTEDEVIFGEWIHE